MIKLNENEHQSFRFVTGTTSQAKKKIYMCVSGFPTLPRFLARP